MERLENVFQPRHEEIFRTDHPLKGKWGKEIFHNDHPIVLEIGCGKGEYTVGLGKLYPEKNFIGIDIKGARMWHGAKTALEQNISNAVFCVFMPKCFLPFLPRKKSLKSGLLFPTHRWPKHANV